MINDYVFYASIDCISTSTNTILIVNNYRMATALSTLERLVTRGGLSEHETHFRSEHETHFLSEHETHFAARFAEDVLERASDILPTFEKLPLFETVQVFS